MTIKETVEIYSKNMETIKNLKLAQRRLVDANSDVLKDPLGFFRIEEKDAFLFASLLSKEIKRLEAELEQEFE